MNGSCGMIATVLTGVTYVTGNWLYVQNTICTYISVTDIEPLSAFSVEHISED